MIALRSEFKPRMASKGPRLASLAGKPFVYVGRSDEHPSHYDIDVWDGEQFKPAVACHDEIFHEGERR